MKKISFLMMLTIAAKMLVAQDIEEVKKYAILGQSAKAREILDKYLAVEKNAKKAEGWFYKGFIYNQLSKDSLLKHDESSAMKYTAFEALKKYREIDPKSTLLIEQSNGPLFDIYVGYSSDLGVKAYTNKNPAAAYEDFKKGIDVHDYIASNNIEGINGFKFAALDTILVLYTAITAGEAKKTDESATYYKKLADANVSAEQYIDVYQVLVDYYKNKKDKASFTEMLDKGRKFYPKNEEYWMAIEIEEAVDGVVKPALFGKYDELITKHPDSYTLPYNYGVELYHYIYSDEMKTANTTEYKTKLLEVIKKADSVKSTIEANFLLTNFLYNNSIDISDEARKIKGPKPDDIKKRKALEADATKAMNESIPFAEKVVKLFEGMTKTKSSEKINYKQSLVILKNIYEVKKDAAKMAEMEKKISAAE
jgi:hypothetical protein